ncbi:MAG: hypothetical protein HKN48_10285, partial [Flavobacteriaceae bacterium]|nr:hypothetical protein [Flavobacteriaceae bacterium]
GQEFTYITTENGLADNNIAQIWQDSQGDVWVGTMFGGVSHFTNDTIINYHAEGIIKGVEAVGFYEDRSGNIWFAVEGDGIYRYDGKNFVNYNEDDGLITAGILSFLEDSKGRFWLGGWKGLFRFQENKFIPVEISGPWD